MGRSGQQELSGAARPLARRGHRPFVLLALLVLGHPWAAAEEERPFLSAETLVRRLTHPLVEEEEEGHAAAQRGPKLATLMPPLRYDLEEGEAEWDARPALERLWCANSDDDNVRLQQALQLLIGGGGDDAPARAAALLAGTASCADAQLLLAFVCDAYVRCTLPRHPSGEEAGPAEGALHGMDPDTGGDAAVSHLLYLAATGQPEAEEEPAAVGSAGSAARAAGRALPRRCGLACIRARRTLAYRLHLRHAKLQLETNSPQLRLGSDGAALALDTTTGGAGDGAEGPTDSSSSSFPASSLLPFFGAAPMGEAARSASAGSTCEQAEQLYHHLAMHLFPLLSQIPPWDHKRLALWDLNARDDLAFEHRQAQLNLEHNVASDAAAYSDEAYSDALTKTGVDLLLGLGNLDVNSTKACEFFFRAVHEIQQKENVSPAALVNLANCYLDGTMATLEPNREDTAPADMRHAAIALLQQAADLGHPDGAIGLGRVYYYTHPKNVKLAREWLERALAMELGDGGSMAHYMLGQMHFHGELPRNMSRALWHMEEAVLLGYVFGHYYLAQIYSPVQRFGATKDYYATFTDSVEPDCARAVQHWKALLEQNSDGDFNAEYELVEGGQLRRALLNYEFKSFMGYSLAQGNAAQVLAAYGVVTRLGTAPSDTTIEVGEGSLKEAALTQASTSLPAKTGSVHIHSTRQCSNSGFATDEAFCRSQNYWRYATRQGDWQVALKAGDWHYRKGLLETALLYYTEAYAETNGTEPEPMVSLAFMLLRAPSTAHDFTGMETKDVIRVAADLLLRASELFDSWTASRVCQVGAQLVTFTETFMAYNLWPAIMRIAGVPSAELPLGEATLSIVSLILCTLVFLWFVRMVLVAPFYE